jgi:hypothetical protein
MQRRVHAKIKERKKSGLPINFGGSPKRITHTDSSDW